MFTPLHCVALRTVRHNDSHSILTVYSLERGRMALLLPMSAGAAAARQRALTMPMAEFECLVDVRSSREVHRFKEIKPLIAGSHSDGYNPVRNVQAFFLADFFGTVLREPEPDANIYRLVSETAAAISVTDGLRLANLHILAMIRAMRLLGVEPDAGTFSRGSFFDMMQGEWRRDITAFNSNYCLDAEKSANAALLARMTAANYHLYRFTRRQRREVVEGMLRYFSLHGFGSMDLSSREVLFELFD